ncbi:MAG: type II toxin-antitoxin system Phd/YefM family antitoxin [Bdellovibrionaceae bacterium]|nr:type II toxin-antitoxin system Phd/YefM family antitoxin [Pseudobdellovibrionaceae bacterium]
MESTSPRTFRANLKEYMDMADEKPIRIQKREGNACVLMSEEYYEGLLNEISSLQKSLLSANQALRGETTEYKIGDKDRLKRYKK